MREVVVSIAASPDTCWRALTDATLLPAWLPGLRRATVIARTADGLAAEVQFEFAATRSYTLLYSYDHAAREIRWEPRMGKRDAVRGFARIEPAGADTTLTYGIEEGGARRPDEIELGDPAQIVAAFAAWVVSRRSK